MAAACVICHVFLWALAFLQRGPVAPGPATQPPHSSTPLADAPPSGGCGCGGEPLGCTAEHRNINTAQTQLDPWERLARQTGRGRRPEETHRLPERSELRGEHEREFDSVLGKVAAVVLVFEHSRHQSSGELSEKQLDGLWVCEGLQLVRSS